MRKITCLICGCEVTVNSGNAKYCSDCKEVGKKQKRKEWESRTGYVKKQRAAARKRRYRYAKIKRTEVNKQDQKDKLAGVDLQKQVQARLEQRAKNGDLYALGMLALKRGDAVEYWRLRKEQYIVEDERTGRTGNNIVGGISPYTDNFEQYVLDQIRDMKNE